jgi:alpha-amylase/alpha-mannosidase (GH57 family)
MLQNKYVCIHGHFYQPPRESAWLEVIELQESAAPFHDWNERINFECYARNTAARIHGAGDMIRKIVNNYSQISFNFGPTLLSWLETADPTTYRAILDADRKSWNQFGGHGNALAQAYNHTILPLANERDKVTQVRWGIADFEHRFGRKPEGIWLPEAAVDTATLEVLAEHDIRFTVLAPRQAKAVRKIGSPDWTVLPGESVDTRRAYLCNLPSGKQIDLFFYDGNVAKDVAFQGLLNNGAAFAQRMMSVLSEDDEPQLSHIATDGESYGHHHEWGEMALAFCLDFIEEKTDAKLTNYGQFLDLHPPVYEVKIHENSSWSCVHGVERWRSDCGCNTGSQPGWNQTWRGPLREALDWLRDELTEEFVNSGSQLVKDIWEARNEYIEVILDRSPAKMERFLQKHARRELEKQEVINLLRMLEIQRQCQLMYTSCAWFFAEVSGIETNQVLQYALRATYHHYNATGVSLAPAFIERLERVPSNVFDNAAESFRANVLPSQLTLTGVAMHYAASSVFEDYEDTSDFLHFTVKNEVFERIPAGGQRLAIGRTTVTSKLTNSEKHFSFAVLYLGQQHLVGSITLDLPRTAFDDFQAQMTAAFRNANLGDLINIIQDFGQERFSFKELFKDEKVKIYKQILSKSYPAVENSIVDYYEDNYQLMNGMLKDDIPVPDNWKSITQFVVEQALHRFFENGKLSVHELRHLVAEHKLWKVQFMDLQRLKLASGERIFAELKKITMDEEGRENLKRLSRIIEILAQLNILPELWKSQNHYYHLAQKYLAVEWKGVEEDWKLRFLELGRWLQVEVDG